MPLRMARKLAMAIAAMAVSGGTLAVAAAPAHATARTPVPYFNCKYPYVCLYNSVMDTVLQYRDITTGFQSFNGSNVYYGLNTRNDDVAYIRYTDGGQACIPAGDPMAIYDLRAFGTPNGIRISSSAVCDTAVSKMAPAKKSS